MPLLQPSCAFPCCAVGIEQSVVMSGQGQMMALWVPCLVQTPGLMYQCVVWELELWPCSNALCMHKYGCCCVHGELPTAPQRCPELGGRRPGKSVYSLVNDALRCTELPVPSCSPIGLPVLPTLGKGARGW